jgi:hypothetical protein
MTTLVTREFVPTEEDYLAPHVVTATANAKEQPRRILATALVLLICAWLLSGFWLSVQLRSPRQPFVAPTASQTWVQAPSSGATAFFLLHLPGGPRPLTATLWLEADQQVTPYINGLRVALPPASPGRQLETATDLPKFVGQYDILASLGTSNNLLGLEVVNLANRTPAFRARVTYDYGNGIEQTFGTQPASWLSTTNVRLTGQNAPESGAFTINGHAVGIWPRAEAAQPRSGTATVTVPPDAYSTAPFGHGMVGSVTVESFTASTVINTPLGCQEGWVRLAAIGSYVLSVDGKPVLSGTATKQYFGNPDKVATSAITLPSVVPFQVVDLCPVLSAGTHTITVWVNSLGAPFLYLDGIVRSGTSTTSFATGPSWHVNRPVGYVANPQNYVATFNTVPATISIPTAVQVSRRLSLILTILIAVGIAVLLARAAGLRLATGLRSAVLGLLPACGLVLVLTELRHMVYVQAPFPSTPDILWAVLLVALAGVVAMLYTAERSGRPAMERVSTEASSGALGFDGTNGYGAIDLHGTNGTNGAGNGNGSNDADGANGVQVEHELTGPSPGQHRWQDSTASGWSQGPLYRFAVIALAVYGFVVEIYRIDYQPLWQDELSSIAAAQGMRAHLLLPQWPSGFLYWKSELYSLLLAVVGGVTHDNTAWLRSISVFWYVATILLVGFLLLPMVLRNRRFLQIATLALFALSPMEAAHARDVRMYQMVQCVVVIVAILLLRAIKTPSTKNILLVMVALVAMYLTHEESFGVLPIIPIVLFWLGGSKWMRNWRWWAFGGGAVAVIGLQLVLVKLTHPPAFGVDLSGSTTVQWDPSPLYYVFRLFFTDTTYGASLTIFSSLALLGLVVGLYRRQVERKYLALYWIIPMLIVSDFLVERDSRYCFICFPFVFALAGCGLADMLDGLRWAVAGGTKVARATRRYASVCVAVFAVALSVAVGESLIAGAPDFGPLAQTLVSANVSQSELNYPLADDYVKARLRPGDVVIAAAPANLVGSTMDRAPDYWVPYRRYSNLLYVFDKDHRVVETQYGAGALLNGPDFERAIDAHPRAWLIVADDNFPGILPAIRQVIQSRFVLVFDDEKVSVFLNTN